MSYWGGEPDQSDLSATAIGANIYMIKKRLLADLETDKLLEYEEQTILAHLICLRLIGEKYPKSLKVHFRRSDYMSAKDNFYVWFEKGGKKAPSKYRDVLLRSAEQEFEIFEKNIFKIE